ncbi:hypothetical protein RJ641_022259 [Dillenia turbinata]|uniref:Uncharacterized protein n=1 Tax=Dillenia turbinata TaxID=194707 RepID=A0AAN8UL70_9MAGN
MDLLSCEKSITFNNKLKSKEAELHITLTPTHQLLVRDIIGIGPGESTQSPTSQLSLLQSNPERCVLIKLFVSGFDTGQLFLGSQLVNYDTINIKQDAAGQFKLFGVKSNTCKAYRCLGRAFGLKYTNNDTEEEEIFSA